MNLLRSTVFCKYRLMIVVAIVGCGGANFTPQPDNEPTARETEHHSHEHDHGMPAHKPSDFAEAVRRLPKMFRLISMEFRVGHLDHAEEAIARLQELIHWLPELAADTDLAEQDWDSIQRISQQMDLVVESWRGGTSKPDDAQMTQLLSLTEQLKPMAEKATLAQSGLY